MGLAQFQIPVHQVSGSGKASRHCFLFLGLFREIHILVAGCYTRLALSRHLIRYCIGEEKGYMGSETFILGLQGASNLGGRTHWEPSGRVPNANWLPGFAQQVIKEEDVIQCVCVYFWKSCLHEHNHSNQ